MAVGPPVESFASIREPHAIFIVPCNRRNGCQLNPRGHGEVAPLPALHPCNSAICSRPECIFSIDMQPQHFCTLEVQIAVLTINPLNSHRCRSPDSAVWSSCECTNTVARQSFARGQRDDLFVAKTVQAVLRSNPDVVFTVFEKAPHRLRRQPIQL